MFAFIFTTLFSLVSSRDLSINTHLSTSTQNPVNNLPQKELLNYNLSESFNWTAAGVYAAYGNMNLDITCPFSATPYPTFNATLIVNPVKRFIAFNTSVLGVQVVNDNGYYYVYPNGTCYVYKDYTLNDYLGNYTQLRNIQTNLLERTFFNLVVDPGACTSYSAVTLNINLRGAVTKYSIANTLFSPDTKAGIKIIQVIDTPLVVYNDQTAVNFPFPASCNTPSTTPYCDPLYPPGFNPFLSVC
jgi:hypothetical protein